MSLRTRRGDGVGVVARPPQADQAAPVVDDEDDAVEAQRRCASARRPRPPASRWPGGRGESPLPGRSGARARQPAWAAAARTGRHIQDDSGKPCRATSVPRGGVRRVGRGLAVGQALGVQDLVVAHAATVAAASDDAGPATGTRATSASAATTPASPTSSHSAEGSEVSSARAPMSGGPAMNPA